MRIIIIVEQQIPSTTEYCREELQIDPDALSRANIDAAGKTILEMQDRVNKAVDAEIKKREII